MFAIMQRCGEDTENIGNAGYLRNYGEIITGDYERINGIFAGYSALMLKR